MQTHAKDLPAAVARGSESSETVETSLKKKRQKEGCTGGLRL